MNPTTVQLNADALSAVLGETGATIPASQYSLWRPTIRNHGTIPGLPHRNTILATDGNLGLFLNCDTSIHFFGHIQHFTGTVKTLFSEPKLYDTTTPKASRPRKLTPTQNKQKLKALALLKELGIDLT